MKKERLKKNSDKAQIRVKFQRFAQLFANGPEGIRNDVRAASEAAGLSVLPNLADPEIRRMIEAEGGSVGAVSNVPVESSPLSILLKDKPIGDEREEWCKLANSLRGTSDEIARGKIKASAAQVSAMKEIFNRCYGKIGDRGEEEVKPNVLVLPTIGTGSSMLICPKCLHEFTLETIDESK